ncbi:MAG: hypothetical protein Q4A75_09535 [Peptostreptococcaceae bacterium]|nr:hypothetical protein [Peptostreptococcaceae bacterium]
MGCILASIYGFYDSYLFSRVRIYLDEEGIKRITKREKEWKSISWDKIKLIQLGDSSRMVKFCFWIRNEKEDVAFSDWYTDYIELSERIIEECQKRNPDAKIDPDVMKRLEQLKKEKATGQNLRLEAAKSRNTKSYRYRTKVIIKQLWRYVLAVCVILFLEILSFLLQGTWSMHFAFMMILFISAFLLYIKIEEIVWGRIYVDEEGITRVEGKRVEWHISWDSITGLQIEPQFKGSKFSFWIEKGMMAKLINDWTLDYIELSERIIEEYKRRDPNARIDPQILRELEQLKSIEK